jgi:DNA-binding HxlR family transcriptional regulator
MKLRNITEGEPPRRRYDEACAATHAMDIIGERWAVPVIRELSLGPRRFSDIRRSINGISANGLTRRLGDLEAVGVVEKATLPPPASVQVYRLTAWGKETGPLLQMLGRWAARSPDHDPTRPFSATSLMLSLRTMFDAEAAGKFAASIGFRLDGEDFFWTRSKSGDVAVGRGTAAAADLLVTGEPGDVAALIYGGHGDASERVAVKGKAAIWQRFRNCFELPEKAPARRVTA